MLGCHTFWDRLWIQTPPWAAWRQSLSPWLRLSNVGSWRFDRVQCQWREWSMSLSIYIYINIVYIYTVYIYIQMAKTMQIPVNLVEWCYCLAGCTIYMYIIYIYIYSIYVDSIWGPIKIWVHISSLWVSIPICRIAWYKMTGDSKKRYQKTCHIDNYKTMQNDRGH